MSTASEFATKDVLAAFGSVSMRCLQQAERIREFEKLVDQLRLDLHHMDIHVQGQAEEKAHLKARLAALMEKAETVKIPTMQAPILGVDEYDLQDELPAMKPTQIIRPFSVPQPGIDVERGNPPLRI